MRAIPRFQNCAKAALFYSQMFSVFYFHKHFLNEKEVTTALVSRSARRFDMSSSHLIVAVDLTWSLCHAIRFANYTRKHCRPNKDRQKAIASI